ncbi:MAG: undecaprenyl-diphosphate phosphatase [Phototrophicaceae bacterium]
MPDWLTVIILGFVEGITEFLPVSSTGHLIIASDWLGLNPSLQGAFEIEIQFGAVLAVMAYYWRDLYQQIRKTPTDKRVQRLWLAVIVAFIPAAVVGLLFEDTIDRMLQSNQVVATALILGGILFLIIEWVGFTSHADAEAELLDINLLQAFAIGVIQTIALIPGTSRSGMSIIGGLIVGLNRRVATQFSFYLSIPTLGIATIYKGIAHFSTITSDDLVLVLLGTLVSAVVAWWSIGWLLKFVSTNTFIPFGYYRILVGILILFVVT